MGAGNYYAKIQQAVAQISSARFLPPDTLLMAPTRWAWLMASADTTGSPLIVPTGGSGFNSPGSSDSVEAQGAAGSIGGPPVFLDPNLPTNLGIGTNQDPTMVLRASDLFLSESDVTLASFDSPYAESMGIVYRASGYLGGIFSRYPASVAVVNGTGTVAAQF